MNAVFLLGTALTLAWPTPPSAPAPQPVPNLPGVLLPALRESKERDEDKDREVPEEREARDEPALREGEAVSVRIDIPPPPPPPPAAEAARAAAALPDRWALMRELQGTCYGACLDDNRMSIYGWTEASFTASTAGRNNQPVVWNDRANEFLLNQHWVRFERSVVTTGTEPTFGFRSDWLIGSDYRFTLPRGIFNSQLLNSRGNQNLYGVDPIAFYGEAYIPTVARGLDLKVGRFFTPFGVESLEAVSTPMVSRSYAFNWCPPFTHTGVLATLYADPVWTFQAGLVLGNDVFIDPSDEARFVGTAKWTQPGGQNTVTVGTSLGRGKLNTGDPFAPATVSLMTEPFGRNNINVFDLVWTHTFNSRASYFFEAIFGYQTNTQGIFNATGSGTATWGSLVHYFNYTFSPQVTGVARFETFDDFQGHRTGFEGLYTAATLALQYRPRKDVIIRPEVRYDHNFESRPFEGKHGLLTAAIDVVFRW